MASQRPEDSFSTISNGDCATDPGRIEPSRSSSSFQNIGLEDLRQQLDTFAIERNWQQFHTPRNLLLALVGEVGGWQAIYAKCGVDDIRDVMYVLHKCSREWAFATQAAACRWHG